ncbi:MAG: hypothetical protein JNK05_33735 [Myxococcales bacterium]|nr:hypothetical protein [Myxococcales bacterium]
MRATMSNVTASLVALLSGCALPPNLRSPDLRDGSVDRVDSALDDRPNVDAPSDAIDSQLEDAADDAIDVIDDVRDARPIDDVTSTADGMDVTDAGVPTDSGNDARGDTGNDTGNDTGVDSGVDSGVDTGADVPNDTRPDVPCFAPNMACGGACVDVLANNTHCGTCGRACTGSSNCVSGVCRSLNDRCSAATPLGTDPYNRTFFGTLRGATSESGDCVAAAVTVFYSLTVTAPSLVYAAVTSNTVFRPKVAFRANCASSTACSSDGCGDTRFEQAFTYVNSGTVFLEVGSTTAVDGDFTLTVSAIRTPINTAGPVPEASALPIGTSYDRTFALPTTTTASTTCGGLGALPAAMYFWTSCPTSAGGSLVASTCFTTRTLDTVLEYRSATGDTTCVDDTGAAACGPSSAGAGTGAELDQLIGRGANLHTLVVRQKTGTPYNTGVTRITISRPPGI